jgi:hypothetical protein
MDRAGKEQKRKLLDQRQPVARFGWLLTTHWVSSEFQTFQLLLVPPTLNSHVAYLLTF